MNFVRTATIRDLFSAKTRRTECLIDKRYLAAHVHNVWVAYDSAVMLGASELEKDAILRAELVASHYRFYIGRG